VDKNSLVSALQLHAVIVSKPGLDVEFLAFAPGGRPAVFWTRSLAEGCPSYSLAAAAAVLWGVRSR
jgi:hypothetical protein